MEAPLKRVPALFQSHLHKWGKLPFLTPFLGGYDYEFCETGENLNLKHLATGEYLHSPEGIEKEIAQWKKKIDLQETRGLIIYGIGLGYSYLSLKEWLHADRKRHIVFIEDDLEVLKAFFEIDIATLFLDDPQVELLFFPSDHLNSEEFHSLLQKSLFQKIAFGALESYEKRKKENYQRLKVCFYLLKDVNEAKSAEFLLLGKAFFQNFYDNFLHLDHCSDGTRLFNQFAKIPAIICGAGPSLNRNIGELKKLKNRALIFAGGTSMNALNAVGVLPHFGCGVDPFLFHFSRIISNQAFEVPYFFRSRVNKDTLRAVHGEKLYLPGATGYPIGEWMDAKVGYSPISIDEGTNVVNLTLSIAKALGCSPILCVGLDLAYTSGESYAAGITPHAIHSKKEHFITKGPREELVLAKDIRGQPVYTLMKWIWESAWYSSFELLFPDVNLINCTEGGIGFQGVKEMELKKAAELFLTEEYDLEGKIQTLLHTPMQKTPPPLLMEKSAIREVADSLQRCEELLSRFEKEENLDPTLLESLFQEDAYRYILKEFDETYLSYKEISSSKISPSNLLEAISDRFPYLRAVVEENLRDIKGALENKSEEEKALQEKGQTPRINLNSESTFALNPPHFKIKDPEILLDIEDNFITAAFDPKTRSGKLEEKLETGLHIQYQLNGSLHGPSFFYYPSGELFCRSWYLRGKKVGALEVFDQKGHLLIRKKYKEDLEEGMHLYFYPEGKIKSEIPYSRGNLEGGVKLYYQNGILKREVSFKKGKKEGKDRLFYPSGECFIEGDYQNNQAIGIAKMWHPNGKLALEAVYKSPGVIEVVKEWDKGGKLLEKGKRDFFDQATESALHLGQSIKKMESALEKVKNSFKSDQLEADLSDLKKEIEAFGKMGEELLRTSEMEGEAKEAIWKTPLHQKMMENFLKKSTPAIQESMLKLRRQLKEMLDSLPPFRQKPPYEK